MRIIGVFVITIFLACPVFGKDESREQKRLEACGQVFKEILDIPDGIPKDLLNKAECVIVIPSVLKFAIGVGGDFGRSAITAEPVSASRDVGVLQHCSRSKVRTSVFSWAARLRTSSSWS